MTVADSRLSALRRRFRAVAAVGLVICAAAVVLSDCSKSSADAPAPLFVFAGQSNMVGQGSMGMPLPPDLSRPRANELFWVNETRAWSTTPPLPNGLYGPEVSAMRRLATRLDGTALAVKEAVSGTALATVWDPSRTDGLYAAMRSAVNDALGSRIRGIAPPHVAAFFWMQGESDGQDLTMGGNYAANLRHLIDQVRSDFGSPHLPVVLGRIRAENPTASPQGLALVRSAIDRVAAATLDVRVVNTDDLPLAADGLHFTGPGLITLGGRFADAYLAMSHS
ncbi:MAG TPA: sialate O-acetylesterase [Acidimicrobiales bacterium]|jgi:hypothetical protein|nr:sialate O-acetylesterase [Acidimicrobiales bacterium]